MSGNVLTERIPYRLNLSKVSIMGKNSNRNRSMAENPVTMPVRPVDASAPRVQSIHRSLEEDATSAALPVNRAATRAAVETPTPSSADWAGMKEAPTLTLVNNFFIEYATQMKTGTKLNSKTFDSYQLQLYRMLVTVLKLEGMAFRRGWAIVLNTVAANQAEGQAFHEKNWGRFINRISLSKIERSNFMNVMAIITSTADPKSRRIIYRQIGNSIPTLLAGFRIADVGERVSNFYEGI